MKIRAVIPTYQKKEIKAREFIIHFHFVGWSDISLGVSISLTMPNIEIHLPFCWLRIGWQGITVHTKPNIKEYEIGPSGDRGHN